LPLAPPPLDRPPLRLLLDDRLPEYELVELDERVNTGKVTLCSE
jgi:hypothetical protein